MKPDNAVFYMTGFGWQPLDQDEDGQSHGRNLFQVKSTDMLR
jgi:hypothetical protein